MNSLCSINLMLNQHFCRPTLNVNECNNTVWTPHTILSSTPVASFILFSRNGQRKGHSTVVRNPCPGNIWCWIAIRCTCQSHWVTFVHCVIDRDVDDGWSIYAIDKGNKSDIKTIIDTRTNYTRTNYFKQCASFKIAIWRSWEDFKFNNYSFSEGLKERNVAN